MLPVMTDRRRDTGGSSQRRAVVVALALVLVLGVAVYLRLWTIDYSLSSDDTEHLRRQFDLANREAMDESAEWRRKYDDEAEKASKCEKELVEIKESSGKDGASDVNQKLETLQKENMALLKQVEMLKRELEVEKLKCHS